MHDIGTKHCDFSHHLTRTCTEVYQPMPTNGVTDMLLPYTPNEKGIFESCHNQWGVTPRVDWEETHFWGAQIAAGRNLFLTNGQLDPWSAGGIHECKAWDNSVVIRELRGAAHHLDLRTPNVLDPPDVKAVRQEEVAAMKRWVALWRKAN